MRPVLISAMLVSNSYNAVAATADAMQPTFGNTVVLVGADKLQTYTQFNADGTFVGRIPSLNYLYNGTWKIDSSGNLCRWFALPVPNRAQPECNSFTTHSVGDTWSAGSVTISIVQGTL